MEQIIDVILHAGRSAIELSLFVLLPVMVVMLAIMRLLEAKGALDFLVTYLARWLRPFGLTGLGVFAALQISFVNFAAPVATLAIMEQRGTSDRHIAATLAMVLAMAQANTVFPMLSIGLHLGPVLALSLVGGLVAAAATYWGFGRSLSMEEHISDDRIHHQVAETTKGNLDVINRAGAEAFKIAIGAIPMLVLSLVAVTGLQRLGVIEAVQTRLGPYLMMVHVDPALILPAITKYLAGGTALLGVMDDLAKQGQVDRLFFNQSAGFLIHPLDIPGVAVLIPAGPRVAKLWKPAVGGAIIGILLRTIGHMAIG